MPDQNESHGWACGSSRNNRLQVTSKPLKTLATFIHVSFQLLLQHYEPAYAATVSCRPRDLTNTISETRSLIPKDAAYSINTKDRQQLVFERKSNTGEVFDGRISILITPRIHYPAAIEHMAIPVENASREDRNENQILTLPSGRTIGYARYGAATSKHPTTIYLHGYPSSRLEVAVCSHQLLTAGLTLIAIDRPGLGLSSASDVSFSERTILDLAEDVRALADHLSLARFVVLGFSGGGPTAFACAHLMPERLVGVAVVCGFGPYEFAVRKSVWRRLQWLNKIGLTLPVKHPKFYTRLYGFAVPMFVRHLTRSSYEKDINSFSFRHFVADTEDGKLVLAGGPEMYEDMQRNIHEATRQPNYTQTHVEEARLMAKPWPFELKSLCVSNLRLFYGTDDTNVPLEVGEMIRDAVGSDTVLKSIEGGTHSTLALRTTDWIRQTLGLEDEDSSLPKDDKEA